MYRAESVIIREGKNRSLYSRQKEETERRSEGSPHQPASLLSASGSRASGLKKKKKSERDKPAAADFRLSLQNKSILTAHTSQRLAQACYEFDTNVSVLGKICDFKERHIIFFNFIYSHMTICVRANKMHSVKCACYYTEQKNLGL